MSNVDEAADGGLYRKEGDFNQLSKFSNLQVVDKEKRHLLGCRPALALATTRFEGVSIRLQVLNIEHGEGLHVSASVDIIMIVDGRGTRTAVIMQRRSLPVNGKEVRCRSCRDDHLVLVLIIKGHSLRRLQRGRRRQLSLGQSLFSMMLMGKKKKMRR